MRIKVLGKPRRIRVKREGLGTRLHIRDRGQIRAKFCCQSFKQLKKEKKE